MAQSELKIRISVTQLLTLLDHTVIKTETPVQHATLALVRDKIRQAIGDELGKDVNDAAQLVEIYDSVFGEAM